MSRRGVAAFDFDGTITKRDTLVPFLWRAGGPARNATGWASLIPLVTERDSNRRRARAKTQMVRRTLGGKPHTEAVTIARDYAATLPNGFRPESLARIEWHRGEGHELILVTASLRMYVEPAAAALGFDHVIAVDLATDAGLRITGELAHPNVRGSEKARRLREYLGAS